MRADVLAIAALTASMLVPNAHALAVDYQVVAGSDYFTTLSGTTFAGVNFLGVPVGPGNTDTIIQRQAIADFGGGPSTVSGITIEMLALQLVSETPFDFGFGTDFYYVTLQSDRGGPASTGTIDITLDGSLSGGTFTSAIDVFFDVRKGAISGPIVLSTDLVLSNAGATWSNKPAGILVDGLVGDLIANHHTDLSNGPIVFQMDFFPAGLTESHPTGAQHVVTNATAAVPEPATMGLCGAGLLIAGLIIRKRSR